MADYGKIAVRGVYSESSSYDDPKGLFNPAAYTATPDEFLEARLVATTAGKIVAWGTFSNSVDGYIVKNLDTTNFIRLKWYSLKGSAVYTNDLTFAEVAAGDTITDSADGTSFLDPSIDVVPGSWIVVSGSGTSANNSTFLVSDATEQVITLANSSDLAAATETSGDRAITIQCLQLNDQKIPPGGVLALSEVVNDQTITITANTASCEVSFMAFGT